MDMRLKPHAPNDLTKRFVDERISLLQNVPESWDCRLDNYYQLDLRMCFITYFRWNFVWGDDSRPVLQTLPITEQPSRVLRLDVSLNDIKSLDKDTVACFKELRALNISINRLEDMQGLHVLPRLCFLDAGFNHIQVLSDLTYCRRLIELKLNHNKIRSLASLPLLPNIEIFIIDGNELISLEGIQSLPRLRVFSARKNKISNITSLTPCKALLSVDLSSNNLTDLEYTLKILTGLPSLADVAVKDNPMSSKADYQETIKTLLNHLKSLDGIELIERNRKLYEDDPYTIDPNSEIGKFKRLTRDAYMDRMRQAKITMEENVQALQVRILGLMDSQRELEKTLMREMGNTLSQLDSMDRLSSHNPVTLPPRPDLSGQGLSMHPNYWEPGRDKPEDRRDPYRRPWKASEFKETDRILKMAALQLGQEHNRGYMHEENN